MQIDISKYEVNKPEIFKQYERHGLKKGVSLASSTTACPLIAIYIYIGEEFGYNEEILNSIDNLTKFYGYTKIKMGGNIEFQRQEKTATKHKLFGRVEEKGKDST